MARKSQINEKIQESGLILKDIKKYIHKARLWLIKKFIINLQLFYFVYNKLVDKLISNFQILSFKFSNIAIPVF
jgi:hypothetical protein